MRACCVCGSWVCIVASPLRFNVVIACCVIGVGFARWLRGCDLQMMGSVRRFAIAFLIWVFACCVCGTLCDSMSGSHLGFAEAVFMCWIRSLALLLRFHCGFAFWPRRCVFGIGFAPLLRRCDFILLLFFEGLPETSDIIITCFEIMVI